MRRKRVHPLFHDIFSFYFIIFCNLSSNLCLPVVPSLYTQLFVTTKQYSSPCQLLGCQRFLQIDCGHGTFDHLPLLKVWPISINAAVELFQGQEVSPIITLQNCRFHCTNAILILPRYFYCRCIGEKHRNVIARINVIACPLVAV